MVVRAADSGRVGVAGKTTNRATARFTEKRADARRSGSCALDSVARRFVDKQHAHVYRMAHSMHSRRRSRRSASTPFLRGGHRRRPRPQLALRKRDANRGDTRPERNAARKRLLQALFLLAAATGTGSASAGPGAPSAVGQAQSTTTPTSAGVRSRTSNLWLERRASRVRMPPGRCMFATSSTGALEQSRCALR
jgi:hypothetical protein